MQNVTLSQDIITTYNDVLAARKKGQTVPEPRYGWETNRDIYAHAILNGHRPHAIIGIEPNDKLGTDYDLIKIRAVDGKTLSIRRKWLKFE
jgi:hypothetical protein